MRRFRSLLIDRANVRIPGLTIMSLQLHRHLGEHASVEPHHHRWCQALLYLSSRGCQLVNGVEVRVEPGTLILLPPGAAHAFQRSDGRAPLCLVIDFRVKSALGPEFAVCSLNRSALAEVRHNLAQLIRLRGTGAVALEWEGAALVLQMLLLLLRVGGWLSTAAPAMPVRDSAPGLQRLLTDIPLEGSLVEVVRRSGYQRDHLNRLVKRETGLSLGQYRARERLARAKDMLAKGVSVAATASAVGLPDQGYFARWFRRQTGQSPSRWAQRRLA